MATRLWDFLTTDIRDLVSLDTADRAADAADAVLGLTGVLAEEGPNVQQLAPLVSQLDSLLDALNSPLGKLMGATLPFVSIGTGLLKVYLEATKKEPTLAQSVALVSQAAYLESFREFVKQHSKIEQWLVAKDNTPQARTITRAAKALGLFELSDREARLALLHFHQSALATAYNQVLSARLEQLGATAEQAQRITQVVAKNTNRHLRNAISDAAPSIQRTAEWYRTGGDQVFEKYFSIDSYLAEAIAPCPHQPVFAESFTFKDIYVPLKAQALTSAGETDGVEEPFILEDWARQFLNDPTKTSQVMFVQGGPGRGKSVFCRMFADWVRRHEHPRWTPILIRLRDVAVLSNDFEETLAKAIDRDFAKTDSGWLTDRNVNFLFILDGFDELLMEGRTSGGLDKFLDQVGRFQEQCDRNSEKNHRVLITGRTLSLQSIERSLPPNLERVKILPMDDALQTQWFIKWGRLMGQDPNHLKGILKDPRLPERLQELAREPLLLYLLGAMHRDGALHLEMFDGADGAKAKVLIYETALDWVLTQQRPDWLNRDIAELDTDSLRRILMEAGLCVVQSGMEFARIGAIAQRLQQDGAAKQFLDAAQQRLKDSEAPLRNALAAFYMQSGRQGEGSVEFVHKSFGEFLCAERIVKSLIDWCQPGRNREYDIQDAEFCWEVYDLLGCHVLTPEIVEYVTTLLTKHEDAHLDLLHKRLYNFYWRWIDGEFIDTPPENFPQKKKRLIKEQSLNESRQIQVDAFAGLNILILLFEIHRHGNLMNDINHLAFHPCHRKESGSFESRQVFKIASYSEAATINFGRAIGPFLKGTDLSFSDLHGMDLHALFLSKANLERANLRNVQIGNLRLLMNKRRIGNELTRILKTRKKGVEKFNVDISAELGGLEIDGKLTQTGKTSDQKLEVENDVVNQKISVTYKMDVPDNDLRGVNLEEADLAGACLARVLMNEANLTNADLSFSDLCGADLRGANLNGADFKYAILSDESLGAIRWNSDTNWSGVKGLDQAINVPDGLSRQLGLDRP